MATRLPGEEGVGALLLESRPDGTPPFQIGNRLYALNSPSQPGLGEGNTGFLVDDSPPHNAMPWKRTLRTVFLFYLISAIFFFSHPHPINGSTEASNKDSRFLSNRLTAR